MRVLFLLAAACYAVKELYAKDPAAALKEAGTLESVTLSNEGLEWVRV